MELAAEDSKTSLQSQIDAIIARYKPLIDDIQVRAERMVADYSPPDEGEAAINMDFDVTWKDEKIVFDLPSVTMRTKEMSMDIPEVTMERKDIIFHVPAIRMVPKKIGQRPVWYGPFKMVWEDIIIDVPEPYMEEKRISFDLPSVTMKRHDWKMDIPEFTMEQQTWIIGLPQITVKNVTVETDKLKAGGDRLSEEGQMLAESMKAEINMLISGGTALATQSSIGLKTQIAAQFDSAIATMQKVIAELVAQGIDPIKVPGAGGDVNLRKQLAELIAQREAALASAEAGMQAAAPATPVVAAPVEAQPVAVPATESPVTETAAAPAA
jgi:hypothetical protein